jgi:uncharacterized protein YacL
MRKYNFLNGLLELCSILLSILLRNELENLNIVFLYKYIFVIILFIVMNKFNLELTKKHMQLIFYINFLFTSAYYLISFFIIKN